MLPESLEIFACRLSSAIQTIRKRGHDQTIVHLDKRAIPASEPIEADGPFAGVAVSNPGYNRAGLAPSGPGEARVVDENPRTNYPRPGVRTGKR